MDMCAHTICVCILLYTTSLQLSGPHTHSSLLLWLSHPQPEGTGTSSAGLLSSFRSFHFLFLPCRQHLFVHLCEVGLHSPGDSSSSSSVPELSVNCSFTEVCSNSTVLHHVVNSQHPVFVAPSGQECLPQSQLCVSVPAPSHRFPWKVVWCYIPMMPILRQGRRELPASVASGVPASRGREEGNF